MKWEKSTPKKPKRPPEAYWCECSCSNCDIGAHERCTSEECHMPKWKDTKKND